MLLSVYSGILLNLKSCWQASDPAHRPKQYQVPTSQQREGSLNAAALSAAEESDAAGRHDQGDLQACAAAAHGVHQEPPQGQLAQVGRLALPDVSLPSQMMSRKTRLDVQCQSNESLE